MKKKYGFDAIYKNVEKRREAKKKNSFISKSAKAGVTVFDKAAKVKFKPKGGKVNFSKTKVSDSGFGGTFKTKLSDEYKNPLDDVREEYKNKKKNPFW